MKHMRILPSAAIISGAVMLAACGSIVAGDPKWEVPIISQNCKPIDGVYFTFEKEQRAFLNVLITDKSTKNDNRFTSEVYDKSNLVNPLEYPFYKSTIIKKGEFLEVQQLDSHGRYHSTITIQLHHPNVGCNVNGELTMRSLSLHYGAEFTAGTAIANETILRKLDDGRLQITSLRKGWVSDMNGLPVWRAKREYFFDAVKN